MSFLTELSLKRASVTLLAAVFIVLAGIYAALKINQELTPDVDFPLVTVVTAQMGAGPQDIADDVTTPLEGVISGVQGIKGLQSISADSTSIVIAQFDFGHDMKAAEQEIGRVVSSARLPADATTPQVTRLNLNQALPVIQISLSGDLTPTDLQGLAQAELVPQLQAIDGVQSIEVAGGASSAMYVTLDPDRMREKGITSSQVSGALQANNVSIPSGSLSTPGFPLPVRTVSKLGSLADVENLVVGADTSGEKPVSILLKEVATVVMKQSAAGSISRTNGQPSIAISVIKTQQGNTVTVAQAAKKIAADAQARLGDKVHVTTTLDLSTTITESINGLTREGITGALVATLAIWIFLLSFRNAIVAAVSIPLSVVVAIVALYFQGFTLNILTLGALTIAVGRVVDDSIVVLENIFRHVQEGDDLTKAVLSGTREVSVAILGATLTTVAVFLPLGFTGGIVGVFFKPFALTVTFALLASLVVALTVVPVLARMFGGRKHLGTRRSPEALEKDTVIQKAYTPVLRWALSHRALTLVIAAVAFFSSFALAPLIPTAFLSTPGDKFFQVSVIPIGSTGTDATLEKAMEAEKIIAKLPDVVNYETTITLGTGGSTGIAALSRAFQGGAAQGASMIVTLKKEADLKAVQQQARNDLRALEGAVAVVRSTGPESTNSQLQISVVGEDQASVQAAITQVLAELKAMGGLTDLSSSASAALPEVAVHVDPQKARAIGQTPAQVALLIRSLTAEQSVTQLTLPGEGRINVIMRSDPAYLSTPDALKNLPVGRTSDGNQVTLAEIADVQQTQAPAQVTRLNQKVSATVNGVITAKNTGQVNKEVQRRLNALSLPAGTHVEYGGVLQQFQDSFNSLYISILAAMVIVYLTMVIVMGSLLLPFIIMFSLPLAFVGALTALAVTGRALSISSLFGVLMLIGIVVTNGIVLIDFVNQLRRRGYSARDALLEGGRLRVRPVLMTAVCTVIALTPMALGFTEGALLATELATVVIGGLVSSTLLTLIVVPVVYSLFEGLRSRLTRSEEASGERVAALAEP